MPKIKVKNIPFDVLHKICNAAANCKECPLNAGEICMCMRLNQFQNEIVELSEKDFPTNREWMNNLSDEDLAAFYTNGILIEKYSPYPVNLHQVVGSFMASKRGIKEWLSKPCVYLMEKEL